MHHTKQGRIQRGLIKVLKPLPKLGDKNNIVLAAYNYIKHRKTLSELQIQCLKNIIFYFYMFLELTLNQILLKNNNFFKNALTLWIHSNEDFEKLHPGAPV